MEVSIVALNPLRFNFTKWSNTLKQFVGNLPTNCLSVFGDFVGLVFKGLSDHHLMNELSLRNCRYFEMVLLDNLSLYL